MSTSRPTFDGAPYDLDQTKQLRRTAEAIALIMAGKINCVIDVTLTANAGSTTITDSRIGYFSAIVPAMAMTAHAAAELAAGGLYIPQATILKGSAVIQHANNAQADRTIRFLILG